MHTLLNLGTLSVTGVSLGGVYTSLAVPTYGICFDVGAALRTHISYQHLFLTHCHSDHVGALTSFLGMRDLMGAKPLTIYVIAEDAGLILDAIELASKLGRYRPKVEVVALRPGDVVDLGRGRTVRAFAAHHVLPCLGYQVTRQVQKLKAKFVGLPGESIAALRANRPVDEVFDLTDVNEFSFVTDTTADVFISEPSILESKVLMCESTFLCDEYGPERARNYSHMHAQEIAAYTRGFQGTDLVLTHFSLVYSPDKVREHVAHQFRDHSFNVHAFAPEENSWWCS